MTAAFESFPNEKRRCPRVDGAGIKVEYSPIGNKEKTVRSTAKNICLLGICVYMPEVIEVTETIAMKIFLPGDDAPVPAKGTIVWYGGGGKADTYEVGIELQDIPEGDRQRLSDYINTCLEE